jgi:hypothetical protein
MKRRLFGTVALAAVALSVVAASAMAYSNGFESDTVDWSGNGGSTINQRANDYVNPGGYASGIDAATGTHFAGLERGPCTTDTNGSGPSLWCRGPFTQWGGYGANWNGPYSTQVDIYLDTAYAIAHPDVYNGNTRDGDIAGLSGAGTDHTVPGTRFDFSSAINKAGDAGVNGHLRDFGFNVSTGTTDDTVDGTPGGAHCEGFIVNATTNVLRSGANPNVAATKDCIAQSGWYTFKHSFSSEGGFLKVVMDITPVGGSTPEATWTITGIDADGTYGCNRYGWFADQEIWGLPIDNAKMEGGCAAPTITDGQILPTGTTCQGYEAGATLLSQVLYTLKGGKINSVAPGVFFYYGTITGLEDQEFTITQSDSSLIAPFVPVQHGQIILYDANCNVVKGWSPDSDSLGQVTGTLPSTGTFIISVKYSAADLKGTSDPATVTYTIDGASVDLAKK